MYKDQFEDRNECIEHINKLEAQGWVRAGANAVAIDDALPSYYKRYIICKDKNTGEISSQLLFKSPIPDVPLSWLVRLGWQEHEHRGCTIAEGIRMVVSDENPEGWEEELLIDSLI